MVLPTPLRSTAAFGGQQRPPAHLAHYWAADRRRGTALASHNGSTAVEAKPGREQAGGQHAETEQPARSKQAVKAKGSKQPRAHICTLMVKCPDKKGVIAALAQLLYGLGCNIIESGMAPSALAEHVCHTQID